MTSPDPEGDSDRPMLERARGVYRAARVPRGTRLVRPDLSGWVWRVSPDVMDALKLEVPPSGVEPMSISSGRWTLFTIPIEPAPELPVNSMFLDHGGPS